MNSEKNTEIRKVVILWFITVGYMSAIFCLSSQNFHVPDLPTNSDKFIHACIYSPLAFLLYLSLSKSGIRKYLFAGAFLLAGIYGITDEFHQSFVPGRNASIGDAVADLTGAFLGSIGASFFKT